MAQEYARLCDNRPDPNSASENSTFTTVGENFAFSTDTMPDYDLLIQIWNDEGMNFNFDSNSCLLQCGAYTQVSIFWNMWHKNLLLYTLII